jgi:hypothetical protein
MYHELNPESSKIFCSFDFRPILTAHSERGRHHVYLYRPELEISWLSRAQTRPHKNVSTLAVASQMHASCREKPEVTGSQAFPHEDRQRSAKQLLRDHAESSTAEQGQGPGPAGGGAI